MARNQILLPDALPTKYWAVRRSHSGFEADSLAKIRALILSGGAGYAWRGRDTLTSPVLDSLTSNRLIPPKHKHYVFDNICLLSHIKAMAWAVVFHDDFKAEFLELAEGVQDELLAHSRLLEQFGPLLGRPVVDTLNESRHANLKELRFNADSGVWRVAFAFDPKRQAILLICGDKSGGGEKRFYKQLIRKADGRYDDHLAQLKKRKGRKS